MPCASRYPARAAAAAIADGRFVYVGDEAGAKAYTGEGTQELQYESGIILPRLGKGHGHINPGGTEALFTVHAHAIGDGAFAMIKDIWRKNK